MKFLLLLIIPLLNFGQNDPTEFCDSIFVSFVEYNEEEQYVEIEFSTQFLTQYWYSYAGFTITNNSGEIIATETLENAANVYGIGNNMTETRYLQITENFTAPLGTLNLVNNLFSGASPESVCSWDEFIDFSNNSNLNEYRNIRTLVKVVDILGRDVSKINKDARLLYIFNDGSIEKKYIVK